MSDTDELAEAIAEAVHSAVLSGFEEIQAELADDPTEPAETLRNDVAELREKTADLRAELEELQHTQPSDRDIRGYQ